MRSRCPSSPRRSWPASQHATGTQAGEIRFEPTSRMADNDRAAGRRDEVAVGRAVELLDDRRRRRDAEAVPPHRSRTASRGRDGPLSDRAGLCQHRAAARRGRAGRCRWRASCAGDRARFHSQPGRCVDLDAGSADARPVGSHRRDRGGAGDRDRAARGLRRDRDAAGASPGRDARGAGPRYDDPAFAPETAGDETAEQWAAQAEQQLAAAFAALEPSEGMGGRGRSRTLQLVHRRSARSSPRRCASWPSPAAARR